jgi:hypothetical protein
MEGAVYEHFPNFPRRVNDALRSIYDERVEAINIGVSDYEFLDKNMILTACLT